MRPVLDPQLGTLIVKLQDINTRQRTQLQTHALVRLACDLGFVFEPVEFV